MTRYRHLLTSDLYRLRLACVPLDRAFDLDGMGGTYLVGSVERGEQFRDVDVRTILPDDVFDAIFGERPLFWDAFCLGVASWLQQQTGLPIDYQVQRETEANANHDGRRNSLNRVSRFAGGGDATKFRDAPVTQQTVRGGANG